MGAPPLPTRDWYITNAVELVKACFITMLLLTDWRNTAPSRQQRHAHCVRYPRPLGLKPRWSACVHVAFVKMDACMFVHALA